MAEMSCPGVGQCCQRGQRLPGRENRQPRGPGLVRGMKERMWIWKNAGGA